MKKSTIKLIFHYCLPFLMIMFAVRAFPQLPVISGVVSDSISGELLAGAVIIEKESNNATTTNQYGYFTFKPTTPVSKITVSYVGYTQKTISVQDLNDSILSINLVSSNELSEVIVFGNKPLQNVSGSSEMNIPLQLSKKLPSFLGEPDILKTIQHLPGVQTGVEGSSGIYVRGGSPDQNLMLIDEVPVYNVGHLMGFFSVFNTDAIRSTNFIKGGLPARYGGRLSSVIDVKMKEGNLKEFKLNGNVGLLSSQATVEAPIIKNKLGFMLAARRTYYDLFFRPILRINTNARAGYYFYDLNGSINYKINDKNSIYYSLYNGLDNGHIEPDTRVNLSENNQLKWGNNIHSLRWNHIFNKRIFSTLTLAYTGYSYSYNRSFTDTQSSALFPEIVTRNGYKARIQDLILKYNFEQTNISNHHLRYGIGITNHFYRPGETSLFSKEHVIDTTIVAREIQAIELNGYFEDEIALSEIVNVNIGAHLSSFNVDDTSYYSFEPRVSMLLKIGDRGALKGSYTKATQYIGLLTSTNVGLPTDLWIPATKHIPPQRSHQFVLGYHHNMKWANLTTEVFYKEMSGLVEFREGASFMLGRENWDELIAVGNGEAYGIEFLAEKNLGKVTGWLSYTLSKNQRHFADIDPSFPYKYDRRHNISLAGAYNFSRSKSLSVSWIYYSGENITISNARYLSHPALIHRNYQMNLYVPILSTVESFSERNNFRMQPYHRLDLGYSIDKKKGNKNITWRFGVYNVYNRKNTFFTAMIEDEDDDEVFLAKFTFAPIMPYVRYEFRF